MRSLCSVLGCDREVYVVHRGLCVMHNARFVKTGTTDDPRPRGLMKDNQLKMRWQQLRRRGELIPEWQDDFWAFVDGVSPKPENAKKMRRPDETRPYGPGNFEWAKTPTHEETKAYLKAYHAANPNKVRESHFKNWYGITVARYDEMLEEQGGVCAICGGTESRYGNGKGRKRLGVDHDHVGGAVRGLLCQDCNVGIGALKDDPDVLRKASEYVAFWRAKSGA